MGQVDHEKGKTGSIGQWQLFNVHEIFKAPELLGIAEIEFDLKTQLVSCNQFIKGECQVGTKENDMRLALGCEIGFDDHHDIERVGKRLMQECRLIDSGLKTIFDRRLDQVLRRDIVEIELAAIETTAALAFCSPRYGK